MLPCNQNLGFTLVLNGETVPKYLLYGKVNGTVYTCNPFGEKGIYGWYISILRPDKKHRLVWKTAFSDTVNTRITCAIDSYIAHTGIKGVALEACQHKKQASRDAFYASKRSLSVHEKNLNRDMVECGRPQKKRPGGFNSKASCQSRIDGKGYSIDWETKVWVDEKNPNPLPVVDDARAKSDYNYKPFEMGQNTSGFAGNGDYTVDAFAPKKNGCLTMQDVVKQRLKDEAEKQKRTGAGKVRKMPSFEDVQVERAKKDPKFGFWLMRNKPELWNKKVMGKMRVGK